MLKKQRKEVYMISFKLFAVRMFKNNDTDLF